MGFRDFDFFRKIPYEIRSQTEPPYHSFLSLLCLAFIVFFGYTSLQNFLTPQPRRRFVIDTGPDMKKMRVNLNMTLHSLPCSAISLDFSDAMGSHVVDVRSTIFKKRLDRFGRPLRTRDSMNDPSQGGMQRKSTSVTGPSLKVGGKNETCGTCYGAGGDDDCCNTCSDVMLAYRLRRWALPRIEDVEQCRNDPQAASMYRPPTIIRLGDFNLGQVIPSIIEQAQHTQPKTGVTAKDLLASHDHDMAPKEAAKTEDQQQGAPGTFKHFAQDDKVLEQAVKAGQIPSRSIASPLPPVLPPMPPRQPPPDSHRSIQEAVQQQKDMAKANEPEQPLPPVQQQQQQKQEQPKADGPPPAAPPAQPAEEAARQPPKEAASGQDGDAQAPPPQDQQAAGGPAQVGQGDGQGQEQQQQEQQHQGQQEQQHEGDVEVSARRRRLTAEDAAVKVAPAAAPAPAAVIQHSRPGGMVQYFLPVLPSFHEAELAKLREQRDETCQIYGYFDTYRVPGNFHIATHALPQEALRSAFGGGRVDMEHTIHHLSISDPEEDEKHSWRHQWALTKLQNRIPLDNFRSPPAYTFQYYLTVIPSSLQPAGASEAARGYQLSASSFITSELVGPAVFFRYDIDPIRVEYYWEEMSYAAYLVELCKIFGGFLALTSFLSRLLDALTGGVSLKVHPRAA